MWKKKNFYSRAELILLKVALVEKGENNVGQANEFLIFDSPKLCTFLLEVYCISVCRKEVSLLLQFDRVEKHSRIEYTSLQIHSFAYFSRKMHLHNFFAPPFSLSLSFKFRLFLFLQENLLLLLMHQLIMKFSIH